MSNEEKLNRWAATFVSLPKETVQESVDFAEFTSGLPSAIWVLDVMVAKGYNVMLNAGGKQASVKFSNAKGSGVASGAPGELAMLIVSAAYDAVEEAEDEDEDEDEDEEDDDARG